MNNDLHLLYRVFRQVILRKHRMPYKKRNRMRSSHRYKFEALAARISSASCNTDIA